MLTTETRFTSMALAFYVATINNPSSRLCRAIGSAIQRNQGLTKVRSWNADLSFKTAQHLKRVGVL